MNPLPSRLYTPPQPRPDKASADAALDHPPDELADSHQGEGERELASSDSGLARVTEDLIDILIHRGVIQFTDFPVSAQAKLLQRRQTRATLSRRLRLLDDESDTL